MCMIAYSIIFLPLKLKKDNVFYSGLSCEKMSFLYFIDIGTKN